MQKSTLSPSPLGLSPRSCPSLGHSLRTHSAPGCRPPTLGTIGSSPLASSPRLAPTLHHPSSTQPATPSPLRPSDPNQYSTHADSQLRPRAALPGGGAAPAATTTLLSALRSCGDSLVTGAVTAVGIQEHVEANRQAAAAAAAANSPPMVRPPTSADTPVATEGAQGFVVETEDEAAGSCSPAFHRAGVDGSQGFEPEVYTEIPVRILHTSNCFFSPLTLSRRRRPHSSTSP